MSVLDDIRQAYPEYADWTDQDLSNGLYKKYGEGVDREEFETQLGIRKPRRDTFSQIYAAGVQGGRRAIQELTAATQSPWSPNVLSPEEAAASIAEREKSTQEYLKRRPKDVEAFEKALQEGHYWDAIKALGSSPVQVLGTMGAEGLGGSIAPLIGKAATTALGGAAGIESGPGALATGAVGAAVGDLPAAAGRVVIDELRKRNVDLTDKNAVQRAFQDPSFVEGLKGKIGSVATEALISGAVFGPMGGMGGVGREILYQTGLGAVAPSARKLVDEGKLATPEETIAGGVTQGIGTLPLVVGSRRVNRRAESPPGGRPPEPTSAPSPQVPGEPPRPWQPGDEITYAPGERSVPDINIPGAGDLVPPHEATPPAPVVEAPRPRSVQTPDIQYTPYEETRHLVPYGTGGDYQFEFSRPAGQLRPTYEGIPTVPGLQGIADFGALTRPEAAPPAGSIPPARIAPDFPAAEPIPPRPPNPMEPFRPVVERLAERGGNINDIRSALGSDMPTARNVAKQMMEQGGLEKWGNQYRLTDRARDILREEARPEEAAPAKPSLPAGLTDMAGNEIKTIGDVAAAHKELASQQKKLEGLIKNPGKLAAIMKKNGMVVSPDTIERARADNIAQALENQKRLDAYQAVLKQNPLARQETIKPPEPVPTEAPNVHEQAMTKRLTEMGLKDVATKIVDQIRDIETGQPIPNARGHYANKVISLARETSGMPEAQARAYFSDWLNHEAVHAFRDLGFLTDQNWNRLVKYAEQRPHPEGGTFMDVANKRYGNLDEYRGNKGMIQEEAVAEAFRDWMKNPTGPVSGIFQRILEALRHIREYVSSPYRIQRQGERVFQAMREGKLRPEDGARLLNQQKMAIDKQQISREEFTKILDSGVKATPAYLYEQQNAPRGTRFINVDIGGSSRPFRLWTPEEYAKSGRTDAIKYQPRSSQQRLAIEAHHAGHRWEPEPEHPQGRFRLDKIGGGEGGSMFGWGAYFAEHPGTTKSYRNLIEGKTQEVYMNGKPINRNGPYGYIYSVIRGSNWDVDAALGKVFNDKQYIENLIKHKFEPELEKAKNTTPKNAHKIDTAARRLHEAIDELYYHEKLIKAFENTKITTDHNARTYTLDISAEKEHLIDLDKHLDEQTPYVKNAIQKMGFELGLNAREKIIKQYNDITEKIYEHTGINSQGAMRWIVAGNFDEVKSRMKLNNEEMKWIKSNMNLFHRAMDLWKQEEALSEKYSAYESNGSLTGKSFMEMLWDRYGKQGASEKLKEAGIPGNMYFDAHSRARGAGTKNFVIWDQNVLDKSKIKSFYGIDQTPMSDTLNKAWDRAVHDNEMVWGERIQNWAQPNWWKNSLRGLYQKVVYANDPVAHNEAAAVLNRPDEITQLFGGAYVSDRYNRLGAEFSPTVAMDMANRASFVNVTAFTEGVPVLKEAQAGNKMSAYTVVEKTKEPPAKAFKEIIEKGLGKQFYLYSISQRIGRLSEEKGLKFPLSDAEVAEAKRLGDQHPEIKEAYKKYQDWNRSVMDFAADTGVISKEFKDELTKAMDYYGLYRYVEVDPNAFRKKGGVGSAIRIIPVEGGFKPLDGDWMKTALRNSGFWIDAGMRNIAAMKALKMAEWDGSAVPGKVHALEKSAAIKKGEGTLFSEGKTVRYYENGKPKEFALLDPFWQDMMGSFEHLAIGDGIQLLAKPANWLRMAVTRDPGFIVANMMRDTLASWVSRNESYVPFKDTMKGFIASARRTPTHEELLRMGVIGNYDLAVQSYENAAKLVGRELARESTKGKIYAFKNIKDFPMAVWDWAGRMSEHSDASTRIAVAEAAKKEGASQYEAGIRALNTLNFSRHGSNKYVRLMNVLWPFLNARIQGFDVLGRGGPAQIVKRLSGETLSKQDSQMMGRFMVRGGIMASVALALQALNQDDPEYQQIPDYRRDGNLMVPLKMFGFDGGYLAIPKPFEQGVMFMTAPEHAAAYLGGTESGKKAASAVGQQVLQSLALMPLPQALLPAVEATANYSFYTRRPIVGQKYEGMDVERQFDQRTSELSKTIAPELGYSPLKMDYLIRGYTGALGTYLADAASYILKTTKGGPETPEWSVSNLPMVKRFLVDKQNSYPQAVADWYELDNAVKTATTTLNSYKQAGDIEGYKDYLARNSALLAVKTPVHAVTTQLRKLRQAEETIYSSPTMNGQQKREALDRIREAMVGLTKNYNEINRLAGR